MVALPLRATLASVLILVSLASMLPVPLANARARSQAGGVRRGKNGSAAKKGSPSLTANQKKQQDEAGTSSPSKVTSHLAPRDGSATNQSRDPDAGQIEQQESSSKQEKSKSAGKRAERWEPPPFDRPPLKSQTTTGPASTKSPSVQNSSGRAADDSASRSGSDSRQAGPRRTDNGPPDERTDPDNAPAGRADRPAPVLRRPSDSRSQPAGPAQPQPPVLRRPSDPPEGGAEHPSPDDRAGAPNRRRGNPSAQPDDGDETIRLEATLVNIPLVVSDRAGRFIPQLTARDFTIYEDGARQEVAAFASEEVPFNVALMLDVSPSVSSSLQDIQDAAIAFVRQLRPQDRVMVISFDRRIHYLSDLTNDRRALEDAIRTTATGSGTSVYDAVYEVVSRRLQGIDGRKALILFSDGEDTTSSRVSYDEAITVVTEADVLVYGLRYPSSGRGPSVDPWPRRNPIPQIPIPLPWPWPWPRRRRGPFTVAPSNWRPSAPAASTGTSTSPQWNRRGDFMEDLATAGGGPVYDAQRIGDLSRLAARIADELRHVYVVSYYPTNALSNGGYRSIRVRVNGRDELAVRHRRGYNAR